MPKAQVNSKHIVKEDYAKQSMEAVVCVKVCL